MTKVKNFVAVLVIALLIVLGVCCLGFGRQNAMAQSANENEVIIETVNDNNDIEPRGWHTSLSLSLNGGNSKVWATVKNDFTLFPATVNVIVELYSSSEYQESYQNMTLVATNSISDLDMGKTIVAESSTGGVDKYWYGRMRYKIYNKAWD